MVAECEYAKLKGQCEGARSVWRRVTLRDAGEDWGVWRVSSVSRKRYRRARRLASYLRAQVGRAVRWIVCSCGVYARV